MFFKFFSAFDAVEQLEFVLRVVRERGWSGADSFNYSPGLDPQERLKFYFLFKVFFSDNCQKEIILIVQKAKLDLLKVFFFEKKRDIDKHFHTKRNFSKIFFS